MNIQRISIGQLQSAPYNPRVTLKPGMPGYERLKRSLDEFELVQPIVWNEQTGHVVGGHQRLQILKDTGVTEVEVAVVSLSLEREKALNVALNNHHVGSNWDYDKLTELMTELIELPEVDETLTGFSEKELNDLMFAPQPFDDDEDEVASNEVEVTFSIDADQWDGFVNEFDALVARFELQPHVRMPSG